ncbi:MAG: hypothetical protein A2X23_13430 [Chloroflexi bacterium GWC2_73_18]|nr:MAG: hypothetical protein A2X23_13430 [Chloroflexi bacterium GWC2_73_18]
MRGALSLIALVALVLLALAGLTVARIRRVGVRDERGPADAIVVLGATVRDGRPSATFAARIEHAVGLFHAGLAPRLVVTGGRHGRALAEAHVARRYALERGVPEAAILIEDESTDTVDSLRRVAALLSANRLRSALFVSDRTHMLRALRIAADLGIAARGSPAPGSPSDLLPRARARATLHELAALARYRLARR